MDEDLLKRNTDCVYFLASPLTCKKGADCEYRHNEIVRLNPRDCWYWLSGNCLNPTCAFRHPPLEGHTGVSSEPAQSSLPANKTIPCYFFFNGYCNKGDRCSFLHGPDHSSVPINPVNNDSGSNDALHLEKKTSSGNKAGVAITTMAHPNPSETFMKALHNCKFDPVEDPQRSVRKNIKLRDDSMGISDHEHEEATVITPDSVSPEKHYVQSISHICTDHGTHEQVHTHIEPEERLESSPGFDVLVDDDEVEDPASEDDSEYRPLDGEHEEMNGQYEFKDTVEYDSEGSEADIFEEMYASRRFRDDDRFVDDDRIPACDRIVRPFTRARIIDSIMSRKRICMPAEMTARDRNLDLRDHLRRRREFSNRPDTGILRRRESSCLMTENRERLRRHRYDQRLGRRLMSEVGFNSLGSNGEGKTRSIFNSHRLFRHPWQNSPRRLQHYRENHGKQQFPPTRIFREPFLKRRRYAPASTGTAFHGPKSLEEIKEEKAAAVGRGHFSTTTSSDFQDPKPLSEILKGKKRLVCE